MHCANQLAMFMKQCVLLLNVLTKSAQKLNTNWTKNWLISHLHPTISRKYSKTASKSKSLATTSNSQNQHFAQQKNSKMAKYIGKTHHVCNHIHA